MIGRTAKAPCGHDGEVVIGTYVRCLQGCDKPKAVAKPSPTPVRSDNAPGSPRAPLGHAATRKSGALDAAERAWFDGELVRVHKLAELAAADAEARGNFLLPFDTQCAPGACGYTYVRNGKQIITMVNSLGVSYEYTTGEIRAAQLTGMPLDSRKAQHAARTIVDAWVNSTMACFLDALPVPTRGATRTWSKASASDIVDDFVEAVGHFARHMYVHNNKAVLSVLLPITAFNQIATMRSGIMNPHNRTVLDAIKSMSFAGCIKSIEPCARLKTHMVTALIDPRYVEAVVPVKFYQDTKAREITNGSIVTSYRIYCGATRADEVVLREPQAVHYTTGIWA